MRVFATTNAAAVLVGYGVSVEVWNVEVPDPEPGALIVQIEAATVCGTDVHMHAGAFAESGLSRVPLVMGHEMVGRIVAIGARERRDTRGRLLRVGDRIAWAYAWCGECYWCTVAGQPTLCAFARSYGWGPLSEYPHATGGFAQFAYVLPACRLASVPEDLDSELASPATCALRTVVHGFERAPRLRTSDTVVVQGAGAVGLCAVAYARALGARRVIVVGAPPVRLELAASWGASHVLDIETTTPEERSARVRELTEGRGADVVVEAAGSRHALSESLDLSRRGAHILVLGQSDPVPALIPGTSINQGQRTIVGVASADVSHFHRALAFMDDTRDDVPWRTLLGDAVGLSGVGEALAAVRSGAALRPVVRP